MSMSGWLPWQFVIKRLARYHGFLDPLTLYARLQRFAQPSEVAEPVELLRAGAIFHARGLINSRVLQHNLDWVWPYWVERQFDPTDVSFLPRAFSITHVNLTHRNWTAVGLPGRDALPIVDPRGLLTPFWDSWSVDVWLLDGDGNLLLPSRVEHVEQRQVLGDELSVITRTSEAGMQLETSACLIQTADGDVCRLQATASIPEGGFLVVSLRPYNPEGVSFIDHVELDQNRRAWLVNDRDRILFDQPVDRHLTSRYKDADVFVHLQERAESLHTRCTVGLATAAAMFPVIPDGKRSISVDIPVKPDKSETHSDWPAALVNQTQLLVPDDHFISLYNASVQTLVLCTPGDVFAGPYTYKRYWYRDAVFVAHGLISAGLLDRASMIIQQFPKRQDRHGYYHSQEGEWDANGEVLWLIDRFRQVSNEKIRSALWESVKQGAQWLIRKRLPDYGGQAHEGLLPAGFSAEHLGPNDHYYWDNFWAQAGLEAASRIAMSEDEPELANAYSEAAKEYANAIQRSLDKQAHRPWMPAIPAAPSRRMDAGSIGSLVASYPLRLCDADDEHLQGTVEFILEHCFYKDGFFQDMIHSGVNAYLTLHVAQALLRVSDPRSALLIRAVARLASPTGHWPEAVHPHTAGGCMGDGHHAWAAAEWVAMMRSCFVREEQGMLIIGSGLLPEWFEANEAMSMGPIPTQFGLVTVSIIPQEWQETHTDNSTEKTSAEQGLIASGANMQAGTHAVRWDSQWSTSSPEIHIQLPGFDPVSVVAGSDINSVFFTRVKE